MQLWPRPPKLVRQHQIVPRVVLLQQKATKRKWFVHLAKQVALRLRLNLFASDSSGTERGGKSPVAPNVLVIHFQQEGKKTPAVCSDLQWGIVNELFGCAINISQSQIHPFVLSVIWMRLPLIVSFQAGCHYTAVLLLSLPKLSCDSNADVAWRDVQGVRQLIQSMCSSSPDWVKRNLSHVFLLFPRKKNTLQPENKQKTKQNWAAFVFKNLIPAFELHFQTLLVSVTVISAFYHWVNPSSFISFAFLNLPHSPQSNLMIDYMFGQDCKDGKKSELVSTLCKTL